MIPALRAQPLAAARSVWNVRDLRFAYSGTSVPAVAGVELQLVEGGITAIIGPNGSGKSTLLRILLGTLAPDSGSIRFRGRVLGEWSREALAREVAVVAQQEPITFPISTRALVSMGRYPHLGMWRRPRAKDLVAVERALERCDLAHLASRDIASLSGGERQRARLARAFAQDAPVLVLDEPTAALDVRHEMEIFELLRSASSDGTTIVLVTHNLNLASRYADRLVMLDAGHLAVDGAPSNVIDAKALGTIYEWPVTVNRHMGPGPDTGAPQVVPLAPERSVPSHYAPQLDEQFVHPQAPWRKE